LALPRQTLFVWQQGQLRWMLFSDESSQIAGLTAATRQYPFSFDSSCYGIDMQVLRLLRTDLSTSDSSILPQRGKTWDGLTYINHITQAPDRKVTKVTRWHLLKILLCSLLLQKYALSISKRIAHALLTIRPTDCSSTQRPPKQRCPLRLVWRLHLPDAYLLSRSS
jgi:hypothetical protein